MRFGFRASLAGTGGVLSGNIVYFSLSAVGLGTVLLTSAALFQVIKWIGAIYLIVVGVKMLLGAIKSQSAHTRSDDSPNRDGLRSDSSRSGLQLFAQGLVTQLSNPKALVFFSALLPQFISPGGDVLLQFLILGLTSLAVELPVLIVYGLLSERATRLIRHERLAAIRDGVAGSFLVCAGVGLATMRRP